MSLTGTYTPADFDYIILFFLAALECYAPKPVPISMEVLIKSCISGDLDGVKANWSEHVKALVAAAGPDDTWNPLLHAVHRLHTEVVRFLLAEGLSPRQRGTVHPYTGDSFMVSDLQGMIFT